MICTDLTSQGANAGKHSCHPRPDQIVKFLKTIGQTLAARRERRPQSGPGPAHPGLNMLLPGMFGASGRLANPTMLAKVVPPGTRLAIAATPENGFDHVKPPSLTQGPATFETQLSWLNTFRGRVGYAFGPIFPYLTGGGAFGGIRATDAITIPGSGNVLGGLSDVRLGWTAGAGLEYGPLSQNWRSQR